MAVFEPEVSLADPTGRAVKLARSILPDGVEPINAMDPRQRLKYPRNIDGATLWELQWAINKHRADPGKIADIRASGTRTVSAETRSVGGGTLGKQELTESTNQNLSIREKTGIQGWDSADQVDEPHSIFEIAEAVYNESDGDGMGVTVDAIVRAYDQPEVLAHCAEGTERVYEFQVVQGDYPGLIRSKTALQFAYVRSIIKQELTSRNVYDEDDSEDQRQLNRIQGCLSTVGVVTDTGQTHVDMAQRGTLRDVLDKTRGDVLCRDIAIPETIGDSGQQKGRFGGGIGYVSERWDAPLAI